MKTLKLFFLATALLLNTTGFAQRGWIDDGSLYWSIKDSSTLIINGKGEIPFYYTNSPSPWQEFQSSISTVIIGDGVTGIGQLAFSDCKSMVSITIPESVKYINNGAFKGCSSLTSITIPKNVEHIGRDAFRGCSNLTAITLPESIKYISNSTFEDCSSLTSITIPKNVEYIDKDAFSTTAWYANQPNGCLYLGKVLYVYKGTMPAKTTIHIKEGTLSISPYAFSGCSNLTAITLPESLTSIGDAAFKDCNSLTSITIPENINVIASTAFSGCSSLKTINYNVIAGNHLYIASFPRSVDTVNIGNNVKIIPDYLFSGCKNLVSVTIPESVTSIGYHAFSGCSNLKTVNYNAINCHLNSGFLGEKNSVTTIKIGDKVKTISSYAFYHCPNLTSITIPASVTSIGKSAFILCDSLTSIDVANGNQYYSSDNGVLFNKEKTVLVRFPAGKAENYIIPEGVTNIGENAFSYCSSLASVSIPEGVTSIGEDAFIYCSSLASVTIPESVTSIGKSTFYGCSSLVSVTIPESVTSIGKSTFYECSSLKTINYNAIDCNVGSWFFREAYDILPSFVTTINIGNKVKVIPSSVFHYHDSLTSIIVASDNQYYSSDDGVLFNKDKTVLIRCPQRKAGNYVIPNSVTNIRGYAFSDCKSLTSITIPERVALMYDAFKNCDSLKTVNYNAINCTYSSSYCVFPTSVNKINIGEKVKVLPNQTLMRYYFPSVYVASGNQYYSSDNGVLFNEDKTVLIRCPYTKARDYIIPIGVTTIGESAFKGCRELVSLTIPKSVTSIGEDAFAVCFKLSRKTEKRIYSIYKKQCRKNK